MKTAKELAGELGLIRKRTFSQSTGGMKSLKPIAQKFGYLIVIDFESTCWKDRRGGDQEIIEFPAVLLNTSTGNIETEFHTYCLPEENPVLSSFCTELTGITQQQVENGIPLFLCLKKFSRWLKQLETEKKLAFNSSSDPAAKLCTFVTWSDWDLGICLHYECQRKQLIMPQPLTSWIDLKATYRKFYKRTPQGLEGALKDVGIEFAGRQHSGLDDAKNTANLAWRMICDGCDMKITRTLHSKYKSGPSRMEQLPKSAAGKATSCPNSFSSNDKQHSTSNNILREQKSGSISSINTVQLIASDSNSDQKLEGQKQGTAEKKLFGQCVGVMLQVTETASEPICHQHSNIPVSNQFQKRSKTLGVRTASTLNKSFQGSTATPHLERMEKSKECQPKVYQNASRLVAVNNFINKTETGLSNTTGRMSSSLMNIASAKENELCRGVAAADFKTPKIQRKSASFKGLSRSTGSSGAVKTAGIRKNCHSANNTPTSMGNSSKSMVAALKTVFSPKSYHTPETGSKRVKMSKVTPPLCNCGKRTRRKTVYSPGPNQGRNFFSCCNRRQIKQTGLTDVTNYGGGCNFFRWESAIINEMRSHQMPKQGSTVTCGGK